MSSSSNQRHVRKCEGVDRISNLPDTVLWHILSFLRTKSAVKTSVLSKRWRYLWTNVPTLDFRAMPGGSIHSRFTLQQKICFKNFIDRVLLHNDAGYLQNLWLPLREDHYFHVKSWLRAVTMREIHKIDIDFLISKWKEQLEYISLPARFLISEKLVVLRLVGKFTIDVSAPLNLPILEILILGGLQLPNDEFMKKLSLGCPILKELRLLDCDGITSTLYVESLSLTILEIRSTVIKSKLSDCGIVIKAPNLRYLNIHEDYLTEPVRIIDKLRFLVEADLSFENFDDEGNARQLIRNLSTVEKLSLSQPAIFGYVGNPPIFQNLTHLSFVPDENMNLLLDCVPRLKSLVIERVFFEPEDFSLDSKPIPDCLTTLESIEFSRFEGVQEDMLLVEYLLNTAVALKNLKLYMNVSYIAEPETDIYLKLLKFPRASAACQIDLRRQSW